MMSTHEMNCFSIHMVTVCCCAVGNAQPMIRIDDFNDGNDDGWTRQDELAASVGPGQYNLVEVGPTSFEYNLASSGPLQSPGQGFLMSVWDESSEPQFTNGFLQAKLRAETVGTLPFYIMRGDAAELTGYSFSASSQTGNFFIAVIDSSGSTILDSFSDPQTQFAAGEDWIFEAGTVGNQLSLRVWRDGQPEPGAPQLTAIDSTYSSGQFAIATGVSTSAAEPNITSTTFDDIYFTIPEPSSLMLLSVAMLGAACACRRC